MRTCVLSPHHPTKLSTHFKQRTSEKMMAGPLCVIAHFQGQRHHHNPFYGALLSKKYNK